MAVVAHFFHGQCVHIGSQSDAGAGALSAQNCDDTRTGNTGAQFDAWYGLQLLDDAGRCLMFFVGQFRMLVQLVAQGDKLRQQRFNQWFQVTHASSSVDSYHLN
jgi:hypothetical protein